MKISVMTWSFNNVLSTGEMDTAATIRYCRELGVDAMELMDHFIRDEKLPAVQAALAETGSAVVCYDVGGDFINPDRSARQNAVATVRTSLERAARLGAQRILIVPGSLKEGISPAVARTWIVEGLKECVPEADRLGLPLTIEDHSSQAAVYGRSDHLNAICDAVGPHLAVTYDVGNFLLAGEDPLQALDRLASRIIHVHFKDWHVVPPTAEQPVRSVTGLDGRRYTGAVLGEGVVDLPGAVAGLRRLGYDGYVSVEYEGVGDPRAAVRQGVAHVRTLLSSAAPEEV
jgi:sugar phosphate isomerase/epimerase